MKTRTRTTQRLTSHHPRQKRIENCQPDWHLGLCKQRGRGDAVCSPRILSILRHCFGEPSTDMLWRTVQRGSFVTEPTATIEKQISALAPRTLAVNHLDNASYNFGSVTIVEICHGIQGFQGIQGAIVLWRWENLSPRVQIWGQHTVSVWEGGEQIPLADW